MTDVPDVRRSARWVMVAGLVAGIAYAAMIVSFSPEQVGLAVTVYAAAGEALLAGENFYATSPSDLPGYRFLYPPLAVVLFLPHAILGAAAAHAFQTVLNVVASVGIAVVLWRALEDRGVALARIDRALVLAFVIGSIYGLNQLLMGQVNHWLGFAFALGFYALERQRDGVAGGALAGAAFLKVFPAAIGLWLLRVRAWRAVGIAIVTGLAGLLIGALVFGPDLTYYYFTEVLLGRYDEHTFVGTPDPAQSHVTARRQLAAIFGGGSPIVTVLSVVLFAGIVLPLYRRIDTDERRLTAILGTIVATLLVLPLQALYFPLLFYPLVMLLYTLSPGVERSLLIAGTLFTYALFGYDAVAALAVALPPGLESIVLSAAASIFTVILPPTFGMWLLVAACVLVHYRPEPSG